MEGAGDRRPERTPSLRIVLQDLSDEDCGLADRRGNINECVVDGVSIRADDRGDQGNERENVWQAG